MCSVYSVPVSSLHNMDCSVSWFESHSQIVSVNWSGSYHAASRQHLVSRQLYPCMGWYLSVLRDYSMFASGEAAKPWHDWRNINQLYIPRANSHSTRVPDISVKHTRLRGHIPAKLDTHIPPLIGTTSNRMIKPIRLTVSSLPHILYDSTWCNLFN